MKERREREKERGERKKEKKRFTFSDVRNGRLNLKKKRLSFAISPSFSLLSFSLLSFSLLSFSLLSFSLALFSPSFLQKAHW